MGKYTQSQINSAKKMNLLDYVMGRGYELIQSAVHEYRLKEHDSLVISNNKWQWFSKNIGGDILDFITKYENKSFMEAMSILLPDNKDIEYDKVNAFVPYKENIPIKEMETIPEKNNNYRRIFAYLCKTRKINSIIVQKMIDDKKLYEDKEHNNCVFVGRDNEGAVKYALKVGTNTFKPFKGEIHGSDKSYCPDLCSNGTSNKIYVYESIIDAMSHATLINLRKGDYTKHNRIPLGGVSGLKLQQFLADNKNVKEIVTCLDNDEAGIKASREIFEKYSEQGYVVKRIVPKVGKDFNDELKEYVNSAMSLADVCANIKLYKEQKQTEPAEKKNDEITR